ncbi:DUF6153 family protein [Streptomyces sp. cg35]|uniref:DUF6153 family protein n=1 Tax=Streptomyces sp. cg35 TaxID=3421650 RepID=UPI003D187419
MATTRGGTGRGQLLLFVALLLGIVGMHTLGHPSEHAAMPASAMNAPAMTGPAMAASTTTAPANASAMTHAGAPVAAHEHRSPAGSGMDPLSVCLAVLGSFTLLLLTAATVLRAVRARGPVRPVVRGLAFAHRPHPPPPRALLSRLSVLRI